MVYCTTHKANNRSNIINKEIVDQQIESKDLTEHLEIKNIINICRTTKRNVTDDSKIKICIQKERFGRTL